MKHLLGSTAKSGCGCAVLGLLAFGCAGYLLYLAGQWIASVLTAMPH